MQTETITVTIWSEKYSLRANWADAASPIEQRAYECRCDVECDHECWVPTMYQVADFDHSPRRAMRETLRVAVQMGGDDPGDPEIVVEIDEALSAIEGGC